MLINLFAPTASSSDTASRSLSLRNRCGIVPSLLLQLLFIAPLLVTQATAFSCPLSESFAATQGCTADSYENQCPVGGGSDYTSCQCALNPGYYFVCTSNCNDYNFRKDGICVQCFAGSYFNLAGVDIQCGTKGQPNCCVTCPSGTFSKQGAASCTACPAGTFSGGGQPNSCNACPVGTYTSQAGASVCVACIAGSFQGTTGQTSCTSCPLGYYSDSLGMVSCRPCPAGTYTDESNTNYMCKPTPPGSYVSATGSPQVYPCPYGSYSPTQNSTACLSCEIGMSTYSIGSASASDCVACEYGVDP
jgi:Tyrosine-protein kinase ephrin type A/B receptor-like